MTKSKPKSKRGGPRPNSGRPTLGSADRKSRQIVVRMTADEYEALASKAACLETKLSTYVRDKLLG